MNSQYPHTKLYKAVQTCNPSTLSRDRQSLRAHWLASQAKRARPQSFKSLRLKVTMVERDGREDLIPSSGLYMHTRLHTHMHTFVCALAHLHHHVRANLHTPMCIPYTIRNDCKLIRKVTGSSYLVSSSSASCTQTGTPGAAPGNGHPGA